MVDERVAPGGGSTAAAFRERLWPSPPLWLLAPGLGVGVVIAMVPVGFAAAVAVGVAVTAAVAAGLAAAAAPVEVSDGVLRAGRARVPVSLLGEVTWAAGEDARQQRGPLLDARAYLCIRGWVDPVVKVEVTDPDDPTPYWLLSSRRPEQLAAALAASR